MPPRKTTARPGKRIDFLAVKKRASVPFSFVLDELESVDFHTNSMFGCLAVYVGEKIVLVLRDQRTPAKDNGVWLATTAEHHASLKKDFPTMRSISVFGEGVTGWQVVPADDDEFEEAALLACQFVIAGDPRIGKIPKSRDRSKKKKNKKSR